MHEAMTFFACKLNKNKNSK